MVLAFAHVINWYYQPYFVAAGINIKFFGWIYAAMGIIGIISSRYTHEIEQFFGNQGSLVFLSMLVIVSSFFLGKYVAVAGVAFFGLHSIFYSIAQTIFNDRVLQIVPESKTATILSINNLGRRLFYAIAAPIFGYVTDVYDFQTTLIAISLAVIAVTLVSFIVYSFIPEKFHQKVECP